MAEPRVKDPVPRAILKALMLCASPRPAWALWRACDVLGVRIAFSKVQKALTKLSAAKLALATPSADPGIELWQIAEPSADLYEELLTELAPPRLYEALRAAEDSALIQQNLKSLPDETPGRVRLALLAGSADQLMQQLSPSERRAERLRTLPWLSEVLLNRIRQWNPNEYVALTLEALRLEAELMRPAGSIDFCAEAIKITQARKPRTAPDRIFQQLLAELYVRLVVLNNDHRHTDHLLAAAQDSGSELDWLPRVGHALHNLPRTRLEDQHELLERIFKEAHEDSLNQELWVGRPTLLILSSVVLGLPNHSESALVRSAMASARACAQQADAFYAAAWRALGTAIEASTGAPGLRWLPGWHQWMQPDGLHPGAIWPLTCEALLPELQRPMPTEVRHGFDQLMGRMRGLGMTRMEDIVRIFTETRAKDSQGMTHAATNKRASHTPPLLEAASTRPPDWMAKLDALGQILGAQTDSDEPKEAETRLRWVITTTQQGKVLRIAPFREKATKVGWGRPVECTLASVLRQESLPVEDQAVLGGLVQSGKDLYLALGEPTWPSRSTRDSELPSPAPLSRTD